MKKLKKCDLGGEPMTLHGINSLNPWQALNLNSPEMMQDIYNNQRGSPNQQQNPQFKTTTRNSNGLNWNNIFNSQMLQGIVNSFANQSSNSRQNGAKLFNQQHFSPLNYLPSNPNTSVQDQYGMKKGGSVAWNPMNGLNDTNFMNWYNKNTPEGKNNIPYTGATDYDYYSFFKNGDYKDYKGGHFPDTYKLPNHETFSNESIYSTPENPGGKWNGEQYDPNGQFEYKNGGFHINKNHLGWCTPMTKSTCTGKRKQFALNAKHHFKKWADGGDFDEDWNFLFGDDNTTKANTEVSQEEVPTPKKEETTNDTEDNLSAQMFANLLNSHYTNNTNNGSQEDNLYDGKKLGKGLDVSGDQEKMKQLYQYAQAAYGNGQHLSGINEMVWNPMGVYNNGIFQPGKKWKGHDNHIHFGFEDPKVTMDIIKMAQTMGLRASENPFTTGVNPVHTKNSFHYQTFKQGGEYDLSPQEIQRLKSLGYKIDLI